MLDYADLSACADFVAIETRQRPEDLETLLELSAGKDKDGEAVHRPYLCAALVLERLLQEKRLLKAGSGATFGGDPAATIRGWRGMQDALDRAQGLEVPPAFAALTATVSRPPQTGSVAVPTRVVF